MIYVSGIGVVSGLGMNVQSNYDSLISGKSGLKKEVFPSFGKAVFAASVGNGNEYFIKEYNLKHGPYSRTSLLGYAAAKEAWGKNQHHNELRTGILSATSVGGMDKTEQYYRQLFNNSELDPSLLLTHDSGNTTEKIAIELGLSGYVDTISTACSSGANAIMLAARLIKQNRLDRVIAGGTDALTLFTIKGFHSLYIYDTQQCKPFDENRNGLNLGEGAGFLLLENERSIQKTGNEPICEIAGWNNSADAYHQTASSPNGTGAILSMRGALKNAGILPSDISYINAHGTGTKNNDLSESIALKSVFGTALPAFSSTKSFTGHTLAAAGAIEAVFSVLAIKNKVLFPNLNFDRRISETGLRPQSTFEHKAELNAVLSNSFGFGGNNTSLVFNKLH